MKITDVGAKIDIQFQKAGDLVVQKNSDETYTLGKGYTWEIACKLLLDYMHEIYQKEKIS